jgi:hypothetical protein
MWFEGSSGRTDAIAVGVQDTNLLVVGEREEFLDLLDLGGLVVVLLGHRRVGFGVDLACLELVWHVELCCN